MSNILKGILNESNPFYGHNDPAKEYGAEDPPRFNKSRSSYRSQEDDTSDADIAYSKKMYQLGQQQKAAKEKAQRDSDHDRLATGTNEGDDNIQPRMRMNDYYELADALQEKLRQAIKLGNTELVHELSKERDDLDARVKQYGLIPESEQLDELDTKLGLYKIAAGKDATAADKAGDYKRGHKRFKGIMKATEKEFANAARKKKDADEKKSAISQGINEFAPIKPPTAGAFGGNKDYGQPTSSRYLGNNKFVLGTTNNYVLTATVDKWGLEWDEDDEIWFLDSPGAVYIADATEGEIELPAPQEQRNQIHDLVSDYLNERNSADLQKVAAYFGHSPDGEMATNEAVSEAPRFNSKQEVINHFVKNGKSAAAGAAAWERGYRGSSKKPIELKKPPQKSYHDELDDKRYDTFENLGDQLKSQSLEALQQIKQQIEQKRAEDLAQWEQDFRNNVANKMRSQPIRSPEATPVAQPGEKHSALKARLSQLNSAIEKQALLDKLVDKLERKGLMTPAMQNDTDTRMHVKYGAKDNYQSLNKKLDNAIAMLQDRLYIRKKSGLKEVHDERDEYDNPRQGRDYGKGNLFVDPGSTEFPKEKHPSDPDVERGRPKNLKGVSKSLPADAFGRTTGKIPDSARPTSNPDPFPPAKILKNHEKWIYPPKSKKSVDEADMSRRGFLGQAGKAVGAGALAAAGLGGASNAQAFKGTLPARAPSISKDEAEAQIEELRNKTYKELASIMWNAWPKILDTTFGANTSADKPATPEQIGKMLGYRLAEYADDYRQKVRAIKIAAGVGDTHILNKTTAAIYLNEQEIDEDQLDELSCWPGHHRVAGTKAGAPGSCEKNKTNEQELDEIDRRGFLKGMGAAAIAGAAGSAMGQSRDLMAGLPNVDKVDKQKMTITLDGQEYPLIILSPTDLRPRGGQQVHITCAELGQRCLGRYDALLAGGRVFVLPGSKPIERPNEEEGVVEGEVIPMQPRNPLNKNLIIQLKALSETALEIFWEGSYMPTAAQGQMAQLSQQEQTKIFNQNVAQFKALGYETAIFEDDMDILFLHSIAREAWYDSKKPMSKYRGLPDLEYNSDTNSLKIIDLIGDDDKGIVYDKNVYEQDVTEEKCPHCGGEMVSEELMNEKKDACYYKVKSRYKVWPSAYASGALVKCRKSGADSWGNGGKKNESSILEGINRADESLHDWFNKEKWVRMDTKGNIKGPCAKEPGEGKPKCLPQSKAHSLGKKGRASAAQRKRREDPNPERSGKAINVDTKKSKG